MYSVASIFSQYRVVSGKFTFRSIQSNGGVNNSPSGNAANSACRTFSLVFLTDPASASTTFSADMSSGGQMINTTRNASLDIPSSSQLGSWLYTSSAAASPTSIDLRDCAFGALEGHFMDTSSTAIVQYGFIVFDAVVQFRGLMYFAAPIGRSLKPSIKLTLEQKFSVDSNDVDLSIVSGTEEKTDIESPVLLSAFDADSFPPSVRSSTAVPTLTARVLSVKNGPQVSLPPTRKQGRRSPSRQM